MIRNTLSHTQRATFSIDLPDPGMHGMPRSYGTGFFVSPDGWFLTAAHVVTEDGTPSGTPRTDIRSAFLMKEHRHGEDSEALCQFADIDHVLPDVDLAILKVDFAANANKEHLRGQTGFPYLTRL